MEDLILKTGVVVLCAAISFLLSGMEAGLSALSRLRIRQQRRAGRYAARVLQGYLDNSENFLWTILIGNTLTTLIIFSLLVVELYRAASHHPSMFAAVFLFVVFLFYVLCDLLPKMFFRQFPNRLCLSLAIPFRFIHLALAPLVWLVTGISAVLLLLSRSTAGTGQLFGTRSELRWVMENDSSQGLSSEERTMIRRVLDLQNLVVSSVMTPMNMVVALPSTATVAEAVQVCRDRNLTRLPVWEEKNGKRRVAGIVSLRTFLFQDSPDVTRTLACHIRPALFLRENLSIEDAFRRMQTSGHRLAVVLDRDQREIGVVSLQDLLKSIFGEVSL
ncbi:MAG: DUF21 domain-containing protein [Pedosphaera sp.]|nr:DUF21 domain-containing protein [Pedosphaera sp.]